MNRAMEPRLAVQLGAVDARWRGVRIDVLATAIWVGLGALAWLLTPWESRAANLALAAVLVGIAGSLWWVVRRRMSEPSPQRAAELVEALHPELDSSLSAAVDLEPDLPGHRFGYLACRLHDRVLKHARRNRWTRAVPTGKVVTARVTHLAAAVFFGAAVVNFAMEKQGSAPSITESQPSREGTAEVEVEPGSTEWERGRSLLISARFPVALLPDEAFLVVRAGAMEQRTPMSRSLEDPWFGQRIEQVDESFEYSIEWPGGTTPTYTVTVFEHPRLERADVLLRFPAFTGLEQRRIEDTRRVTAVEGTVAELVCHLNAAGVQARLVDVENGDALDLTPDPENPLAQTVSLVLERTQRRRLELMDANGRREKARIEFVFRVTENRAPSLNLTAGGDRRVSPLQEVPLRAEVSDDFRLERAGIGYRVGTEEPVELVLAENTPAGSRAPMDHTLALEELEARPAQLVSYWFWAEDRAGDDTVRRTTSDLYFAEVRPFEERFRQGRAQTGNQSRDQQRERQNAPNMAGGGAGAEDLLELQRQVLLAAWRLRRELAESGDEARLVEEAAVVHEAQESARAQVGELALAGGEGLDLEALERAMTKSAESLLRVVNSGSAEPLDDTVTAAQEALALLLTAQSNEFEVMRAQQQDSGQRSNNRSSRSAARSSPSAQQLQQLELRDENRYETQTRAQSRPDLAESEAAAEGQDLLQRLRELARRQEDLREQVRELEAELQAARDPESEEELQRRLARLQEDQEQVLRDTDELLQDMQQRDQNDRLAAPRERMERSRENVQRASEALEQGRVAEAVTESARASRELEEAEREMRERVGENFRERVQDLGREAERLQGEQRRIADALRSDEATPARSLRETNDREQITEHLRQQEDGVRELIEELENTVLDAEETEPLLAEELFETLEDVREQRTLDALEMTRRMVQRGFDDDAAEVEELARGGIDTLREGIRRAEEDLLATDVEALERAERELAQLGDELRREVERERGERTGDPGERATDGEPREGVAGGPRRGPLTGDNYRDWSERLRDVEDMVDDPELSAEAARLRSRARGVRSEFTRHSEEPNWDLVMEEILEPLDQLHREVKTELLRRGSKESLVPLDREPVPPEYEEAVRQYFERLGREQ